MNERDLDVQRFLEYSFKEQDYLEPSSRFELNREYLLDAIKTYNPEVIVKAGVGGGALLAEIAKLSNGRVIAVDPSISIIRKFMKDYGKPENLDFIAGDFNTFPIDYYAADMIITIDNISFIESSSAIDEFRRALKFEGILYIASPITSADDEEGVFDDYMRMIFPLHNEFYMAAELRTVLELNEFKLIQESIDESRVNAASQSGFFAGIYEDRDSTQFIESQKNVFDSLYGLNEGVFTVPYYSGIFMRIKPDYVYEKPMTGDL